MALSQENILKEMEKATHLMKGVKERKKKRYVKASEKQTNKQKTNGLSNLKVSSGHESFKHGDWLRG